MQLVEQCPPPQKEEEDFDGNKLDVEGLVKSDECVRVPAMRCKIEKVIVLIYNLNNYSHIS